MKNAVILILVGLVAMVSCDTCDKLTRLKIQGQWRRAYSSGSDRENFAQAVWRAFFAQAPEARALFSHVGAEDTNSGKFKAFAERSLGTLDIVINLLDQPATLKAVLDHMHAKAAEKHIPEKYYAIFRTSLGHVLPAQLGRCWDKEAWKACSQVVSQGILGH